MHLITLLTEQIEMWMEEHPRTQEDGPGTRGLSLEAEPTSTRARLRCCKGRAGPNRANAVVRGTSCTAQCFASGTSASPNALQCPPALGC